MLLKNKNNIRTYRKVAGLFLIFSLFFSSFPSFKQAQAETPRNFASPFQKNISKFNSDKNQEIIEGEIIVKYKKDKIDLEKASGRKKAENSENSKKLEKLDEVEDLNLRLVKTARTTDDTIQELLSDPDVEFAEPNFKRHPMSVPNDTEYLNQWALPKISAPEAWDLETADQQDIIVAVIDTGVDYTHPDLIGNMWNGTTCVNENNVAISGGCPNHGWNFEHDNNDPFDIEGHGTFVAGVIAGTANNSKGISGTSFHNNIKIMPIKFGFDTMSEIKAINFAKNNGARVINASFGGSSSSSLEKNVIDAFPGIFVSAAGNDGTNNDTNPLYPASYTSSNIISVSATDSNDNLASFSNYGATSVDLAAPGVNIQSTDSDNTIFSSASETFDSSSLPYLPTTFSNTSGQWQTASWQDPEHPNDKYASPGITYNANTDIEIVSAFSTNTSSSEALYLSFYIEGDIESAPNCANDYLNVYTSDNTNISTISSTPVHRFWSPKNRGHFYTSSESERAQMLATYSPSEWTYEGVAYNSYGEASGNLVPVYRFWSAQNQHHFYTASETEKNSVDASYTDNEWKLEGIAYYAYTTPEANTKPVYRFWSAQNKVHFYTGEESEKNSTDANYSDNEWKLEGAAWYVPVNANSITTENWTLQEKYCGFSAGETVSLDLTAFKSLQMKIKFLWHTDGNSNTQNFSTSPTLPKIDDVLLEEFNLNSDAYQSGGAGTSYATPLVAGAVAMALSKKPTLSSSDAKSIILNSVDQIPALSGKSVSGGRLNLKKVMEDAAAFIPF